MMMENEKQKSSLSYCNSVSDTPNEGFTFRDGRDVKDTTKKQFSRPKIDQCDPVKLRRGSK